MGAESGVVARGRRVILIVEAASAYGRGCLRGIARYARAHGGWVFFHSARYLVEHLDLTELQQWQADGVIARIENDHIAGIVRALGLPTVDVRGPALFPGTCGVFTDDRRVVELAADHLTANGLKHLAFCGYRGVDFSDARLAHFQDLPLAGVSKHAFARSGASRRRKASPAYERMGLEDRPALQEWLLSLPKPVGVIACNDTRGRQVLQACAMSQLKVPYDVAVVGVDDDDVLCELSQPTLSSVAPNLEAIGAAAAQMLDRLLTGAAAPTEPLLIPPVTVEVRGSSDVLAVSDPTLVEAIRLIRAQIGQGVNVKELLTALDVSRSTLERLFRDQLGCTPYDYILRHRIDRVKQLLIDTSYPLSQVSRMAGFRNIAHMTAVFRERVGVTPGLYRREAS